VAEDISTLGHRVRLPVIGRYLGQLGLVMALLMAVPLAGALLFGNAGHAVQLLEVTAVLLLGGLALSRLPATESLQINEALAITVLAFVLAGLSVAYALAAEPGIAPADALFEGVSAVTTTGLSTLDTVQERTPTFLLTRAWAQWFGGLGIVVLTVALVSGHHVAARRLTEPAGENDLETTARLHARRMLSVYVILTALALALVLPFAGETLVGAAHVLTAVSTGGFSTYDNSLAGFTGSALPFVLILFAFVGATPLPFYYRICRHGPRALADPEVLTLAVAVACIVVMLSILAPQLRMSEALLLGTSAQTGTGFTPVTVAGLPPAALALLLVAMITGGTIGSTSGGIKMLRLLLLLRLVQTLVRRTALPPHAVFRPRIGGHPMKAGDFNRAALVLVLFLAVIFISWLPFVAVGYPPLHSLFEVCSATGTVGLSTGIADEALPVGLKFLLCADMLLGRVEVVAVLILLYPRTWFGRKAE